MNEENFGIMINKMYSGEYTIDNVGHEVINFFTTDNGENYIYALPHGGVSKIRDNKIKYILLTSAMEDGKLEILAKAEVEKQIRLNGDNFKKEYNKEYNQHKNVFGHIVNLEQRYIISKEEADKNKIINKIKEITDKDEINDLTKIYKDKNNIKNKEFNIQNLTAEDYKGCFNDLEFEHKPIKYAGKFLYEIFGNNIDDDEATYITYKIKSIVKPRIQFYLTNENAGKHTNLIQLKKSLPKSSLKSYIIKTANNENSDNNNDYEKLEKFINTKEYWEEAKIEKIENREEKNEINFLQLIGKEDDETSFTNMMYYWFSIDEVANKFIKEIKPELSNKIKSKLFVSTEKVTFKRRGRIDILFQNDDVSVIIENKIHSGLNGLKIYESPNGNKERESQISTYFNELEKEEYEEGHKKRDKICLIFVPDYHKENIKKQLEIYEKNLFEYDKKIIIVTYSMLNDWFVNNKTLFEKSIYCKYFPDFLNSLGKHIFKTKNEYNQSIMEIKFRTVLFK